MRLGLGLDIAARLRPGAGVDTWADDMLASYRTLNPEQAAWFDGAGSAVETELLARLQPGEYLHTTFGPSGQNKAVCDFVYVWQTSGDITSRIITKSGDTLRWDIDGTATNQNDLPAHTLGAGAGVLTVSSTDGWSGVTNFQIWGNSLSGVAPSWDFPNVAKFYIHVNSFSGTAPSWGFPNVNDFLVSNNNFSGTAPNWNFPNVTRFWMQDSNFDDLSSFLANLHTEWANKVGTCVLQIQNNSATLSGTYADEDPPTTDLGYIYELANDPESTGYPVYTITYDAP